jgi:hypothetical protein
MKPPPDPTVFVQSPTRKQGLPFGRPLLARRALKKPLLARRALKKPLLAF